MTARCPRRAAAPAGTAIDRRARRDRCSMTAGHFADAGSFDIEVMRLIDVNEPGETLATTIGHARDRVVRPHDWKSFPFIATMQ